MNFQFCSLISNQFVANNGKVDFINENQILLIESSNEMEIVSNNTCYRVLKGTITIAKGFQIINPLNKLASFRGIIFDSESKRLLLIKPIFVSEDSLEQFIHINKVINHSIDTDEEITKMNSLLNNFFEEYILQDFELFETNKRLKGRIDTRLLLVNRYMRKNYYQQLTLQDLADLIGCNPVYLSNMYSKIFKVPPMKYLQRIRMNRAKELISNTSLSISEVAQKLGYVSSSQFGVLFKKHYRSTPYEFRLNYIISVNKVKDEY